MLAVLVRLVESDRLVRDIEPERQDHLVLGLLDLHQFGGAAVEVLGGAVPHQWTALGRPEPHHFQPHLLTAAHWEEKWTIELSLAPDSQVLVTSTGDQRSRRG